MADSKQPTGAQGDFYPPPPPGPPPGHNGLGMHPNEQPIPDSQPDIYNSSPPIASGAQQSPPHAQTQLPTQQTAHQPPPTDTDGAPKKTNWTQRLSVFGSKAAAPFNMLANKLGSEAFLPSTMDKECEKAARILRNFCSRSSLIHHPSYTHSQSPQRTASTQTPKPPRPSKPPRSTPTANPPLPPPSPKRTAPSSPSPRPSSKRLSASPSSPPHAPVFTSQVPPAPASSSHACPTAAGRRPRASRCTAWARAS